jgi:hypothetical protein
LCSGVVVDDFITGPGTINSIATELGKEYLKDFILSIVTPSYLEDLGYSEEMLDFFYKNFIPSNLVIYPEH